MSYNIGEALGTAISTASGLIGAGMMKDAEMTRKAQLDEYQLMRQNSLAMAREESSARLKQKLSDESKIAEENRAESKDWAVQNEDGTLTPIAKGAIEDKKKADVVRAQIAKDNEDIDRQQYEAIEKEKAHRKLAKELDPNYKDGPIDASTGMVGQVLKDNADTIKDNEEAEASWSDEPTGKLVRIASVEARQKHLEKLEEKALELERRAEDKRLDRESRELIAQAANDTRKAISEMGGRMERAAQIRSEAAERRITVSADRRTKNDYAKLVSEGRLTNDALQALNDDRDDYGLRPLSMSGKLVEKNEKEQEAKDLEDYKKNRSNTQAIKDSIPLVTPSAEENAKKQSKKSPAVVKYDSKGKRIN